MNSHRVKNVAHVRDYEYTVQVNRWFLRPIGAWPKLTSPTRTERVLAKLLNVACHTLIIFTFAPSMLFILFEETSMEDRMKAIGPMSHWLMGELNYCCLLMKTNDISYCVEHVQRDWKMVKRPGDREQMLRNAKVGRYIAYVAALCMNVGVFSNILMGFRRAAFHVGNESFSMYRLSCPFYTKLMDARFSPANEIVFSIQFVSAFIVNSVTIGACGLAAVLASHACGQLNIVMCRLDDLVDQKRDWKPVEKKLAIIVERHLRALSLVTYIEKVMHPVCFVELLGCTFNICMLEYYFLTEKSKEEIASYAIVFASMSFNIFIFCYIAEKLTDQCKMVGERAYMTEWYLLPRKTALGLVMIISRSSLVIKITAGKVVRISIATFGDVFKASFTYLNMLRTVAM